MSRTAMQEMAYRHPCFLAEETAHPQFGMRLATGTLNLSINSGFE